MPPSHSDYYFGAGPARLPPAVRQQICAAIDHVTPGVSILELSHRSETFANILHQARRLLRSLYAVPDHYHILFMQGGASSQFDAVPLNILGDARHASYLDTGLWSCKAARLAAKYTRIKIIAGLEQKNNKLRSIDAQHWRVDQAGAYFHITPNETADGIALPEAVLSDTTAPVDVSAEVPVVADMTSCLLMRKVDFSRYGIVYAGAQKTLGIAGVTIVIVRDDLLHRAAEQTPHLYRYDLHVRENSIVNTAPVFACYVTGLMLAWVHKNGGIEAMRTQAKKRADLLYAAIDAHPLLQNNIDPASRSPINVVFNAERAGLIEKLLRNAQAAGLSGLAGHRLVGGVRASMYNGTPVAAVEKLAGLIAELT